MRIIDIWKNKLPNTYDFLTKGMTSHIQNNPAVWKAFLSASYLSQSDAQLAITENSSGPLIWFLPLNLRTGGCFDPQVPGRISLSSDIASEFEKQSTNPIAQDFMMLTTLHEMCHWAWHNQKIPDSDSAGEKFELAVNINPDYSWLSNAQALSHTVKEQVEKLKESLTLGKPLTPSIGVFVGSDVAQGMKRGIRNNNPGNIRVGDPWLGLSEHSRMTEFQRMESSFCVFCEPEWGLRAMIIILRKYQNKYNLFTPFEIIKKWAPPEDNNDVTSYAKAVAQAVGIEITDKLDLNDNNKMISVLKAMGKHENGVKLPYHEIQYQAALVLASQ